MGIRFTPKYNEEIRRVVHNFNQNRNRALKSGYPKSKLPTSIKVSELKARHSNRASLNKELKKLEKFNQKNYLKTVTTDKGVKINKWNYDYLKYNRDEAIKYFEGRRKHLQSKIKHGYPGESLTLDNVKVKLKLLRSDLQKMTDKEVGAYNATIQEYLNYPAKRAAGYRGFLTEVDFVMQNVQIPKKQRDEFFKKFTVLDADQFHYLYENSDLIERIYDLIDSPSHGGDRMKMNTTEEDAADLINTLFEDIDQLILEAQEKG